MPVRISMAWLCILCAGGLGFLKGQRLRKRIRILERIVRLLDHMERELEFGREPLPEVFKKLSEKNTGELKAFLEHAAVQMQQGKDNIAAVFAENVRTYLSEGDLFAEDLQRLYALGSELGYPDRQLQIHTVAVYRQEIKELLDELKKQYPQSCRLFRIGAVGILVSVLTQVLKHSGRDEQAFLASLAGLVLVLMWIIPYIADLFGSIETLFGYP